jgi:hypothetical protein
MMMTFTRVFNRTKTYRVKRTPAAQNIYIAIIMHAQFALFFLPLHSKLGHGMDTIHY